MSPRIQAGAGPARVTRMIDSGTVSPKVAVPTTILALIGLALVIADAWLDIPDELYVAFLSAGGITGVTGYSARPGAVVTDTPASRKRPRTIRKTPMQGETGERGQTNVWFLLGALTVAVVVLALVALT